MVKFKNQHNQKEGVKQGGKEGGSKTRKIKASTRYGYIDEHLSPYGGLLPLVKLWDGLRFDVQFSTLYCEPTRETQYGSLFFIKGFLLLLFIGFCRLNHFVYIFDDPMLLGIFSLSIGSDMYSNKRIKMFVQYASLLPLLRKNSVQFRTTEPIFK